MAEVYVSECCGGVFVPGHGPDDIHDAEEGDRLVLEVRTEETPVTAAGAKIASREERWERTYRVSGAEASLYDAMRAGDCPNCGESTPGLSLLFEAQDDVTKFMPAAHGGN